MSSIIHKQLKAHRRTDRQTSLAAWSSLAFGEVEDQGNWDDDVDSSCHTWRADADCDSSYMCHTCHTVPLSVTQWRADADCDSSYMCHTCHTMSHSDEQMLIVTLLTCVTPVTECHTVTLSVTQWRADADCDSSYMCHTCHTMSHSATECHTVTSRCWLWLFLHVSHLSHNDTKCHTVTSRCWLWLFLHVSHLSHNVTQCNWVSHSDEQMLIVTFLTCVTPVTQWH